VCRLNIGGGLLRVALLAALAFANAPEPKDFPLTNLRGSNWQFQSDVANRLTNTTTAPNQPPVVMAGGNRTVYLPATATLHGTVFDDGLADEHQDASGPFAFIGKGIKSRFNYTKNRPLHDPFTEAAAQRALCLRAIIRRGEIEVELRAAAEKPNAPHELNPDSLKVEARQINDWLKDEELWLAASDNEKKAFNMIPGSWPQQLFKDASWRLEALGVIGWALGLADCISSYDSQLDSSSIAYRGQILSPTKELISKAHLRAEKDVLQAREIAESWLWRARTTQIQKQPDKYPPPPGWTYEKIIALAAEHWEKAGLFQAVRGDYPARGKAYAELTDDEWQELQSIATERLQGLNWLCKYSANWDLVPTGT
jgi:Domain of unknown function (DUF4272)